MSKSMNFRWALAACLCALATGAAQARQELPKEAELGGGSAARSPFLPGDFVPSASAPFADFSKAWPARAVGESAGEVARELDGVIVGIEPPEGMRILGFDAQRQWGVSAPQSGAQNDAATLLGDFRKYASLSLERSGSMLVEFNLAGPDSKSKRQDRASAYFKFVSAQDATPAGRPRKVYELQRTWFAFYDAAKTPENIERPVVVIIPGMFGTPEPVVNGLVNRLRLRGWPVLRMIVHPSRFTENRTIQVDAENFGPGINLVADVLCDRAAECAYATRAALRHVEQMRPELAGRGVVAIGFSGGAMAMPAVVALEPARYKGVVLVGGGCDWFLINERSNYASWIDALNVEFKGDLSAEQKQAIDAAYLERATLDGYHTAAVLRQIPTLIVQGSVDRAVPSDLGDLLWERAGRPDRWLEAQTHEALFLTLPARYDAMIDWLSGKTQAPPADTGKAPGTP